MNRIWLWGLALVVAVGLSLGGVYWWHQKSTAKKPASPAPAAQEETPATPAPPPVVAAPAVKHPIEDAATAEAGTTLPTGADADAQIKSALDELLGNKAVSSFLQVDNFAQRVVATVDNLGRQHAAPRLWPVNPIGGRFTVAGTGADSTIGAENSQRYGALLTLVEKTDTTKAAALYKRLYPHFQRAYKELGYPDRYFNDRLVEVIDLLLATPEPAGPIKVELVEVKGPTPAARPWVNYEFADPALAGLSSGQKMLLRAGLANERRMKAKLTEFRKAVVK